jgi:hypothetical protein
MPRRAGQIHVPLTEWRTESVITSTRGPSFELAPEHDLRRICECVGALDGTAAGGDEVGGLGVVAPVAFGPAVAEHDAYRTGPA